ncbi:hypothetical protein [Methylobacterium sp. WL8]|uniref:hypothetical protein n=1 Tax=Methylobacterium sp. WL8 TaxID=2603899 RepID=UPI0011CCC8E6|nr:hypothetical protein [Methylobacterium sp. WL8]TXN80618.1 hypothetical protein FV234_16465 [Methylobacterium sp. WL8]
MDSPRQVAPAEIEALIRQYVYVEPQSGSASTLHGVSQAAGLIAKSFELAALRSTRTDRSEAEAGRPAEGVRPPGETLWLAHGAMFGSASGDWDDLDLINKLRWASVEDSAVRNLMAQSNTTPPARGRENADEGGNDAGR